MPYTLLCASQRVFNKPRFQDVYVWAGRATFHNPVPHCRAARIIFGCCTKSQELSRSNGVPNTLHVGQRKQDIVPGAGSPLTVPLHRIPEQTEASARSLTYIDPVCRCTLVRANPEKRAQGPGEDSKTAASPEYKLLEYVRSYDDGPAGRRAHVVREPLQHLRLRARDESGDDLEQLGAVV